MMWLRSVGVALGLMFGLSGCLFSFVEDQLSVDPLTLRQHDTSFNDRRKPLANPGGDRKAVNLDVFQLQVPGPGAGEVIEGQLYQTQYLMTIHHATYKEAIQAWGFFLMERSENQCEQHQAGTVANFSTANALFATAATAVGTAGSLVTGATAARILSGTAGGLTGLRSVYNENFYQNLLATAIIREIIRLRKEEQSRLYRAIKAGEYDKDGSPNRLLYDINRYHLLCSFYVGLAALTDPKQRIVPVARNLKAQLDATNLAIERYNEQIKEEKGNLAKGQHESVRAEAGQRIKQLYQSLRDAEARRNSLETQLSLAEVAANEPTGTIGVKAEKKD